MLVLIGVQISIDTEYLFPICWKQTETWKMQHNEANKQMYAI